MVDDALISAIRFLCSSSLGLVNSNTAVIQESKKPRTKWGSQLHYQLKEPHDIGNSGVVPKSTAPVICETMALSSTPHHDPTPSKWLYSRSSNQLGVDSFMKDAAGARDAFQRVGGEDIPVAHRLGDLIRVIEAELKAAKWGQGPLTWP